MPETPSNVVEFPGMMPDYLHEDDKMDGGRRGEHGIGWVHVSLLRSYAGDCAITGAKTDEPSDKALWQRRERWFDEIASVIEQFCPPREDDLDGPERRADDPFPNDAFGPVAPPTEGQT